MSKEYVLSDFLKETFFFKKNLSFLLKLSEQPLCEKRLSTGEKLIFVSIHKIISFELVFFQALKGL
jgi:hypothetical protein